jgi:hypothetical protein
MNKRKILIFTSVVFGSTICGSILFTNCSKSSFSTRRDDSSFVIASTIEDENQNSKYLVSCLAKTFNKTAVLKLAEIKKYSEDVLTNDSVTPETVLVVKIDHQCLANSTSLSPISNTLKNRPEGLISDLEFGSYKYSFTATVPRADFENIINNDACIHYIDKNTTYTISSSGDTDDQYYNMQTHLSYIKHPLIYKKVFNPLNGINKEVRIAIIDSGVDISNPDLTNNILRDVRDQVIGLNAISNNTDVSDSGFHGTHVAGIAGASSGNQIGVSGVLGAMVKIIPIRVSNDGSSVDLDAVINGIYWATKQKADVINMSLSAKGAAGNRPLFKEAIANAIAGGVTVVVAAGNDGQTITTDSSIVTMKDCYGNPLKNNLGQTLVMDTSHVYPMKYSNLFNGLISVGSVDTVSNSISCFSNRSSTYVKIMAPGSAGTLGIISTVPTRISALGYANKVGLSPINGTSMSSPVVAGAAALTISLARSRGYNPLPEQIEKLLLKGSIKTDTLKSYAVDGNNLDLNSLIELIDQDTNINSTSSTERTASFGNIQIAAQPANKQAILGETVNFEVMTTESSSILINYQWYRNNKILTGANSRILTIPKTLASHSGEYHVVLSAGKTTVTSQKATLTLGKQYCD